MKQNNTLNEILDSLDEEIAKSDAIMNNTDNDDNTDTLSKVKYVKSKGKMSAPAKKKLILSELPNFHGMIQGTIDSLRADGFPINRSFHYREMKRDPKYADAVNSLQELTVSHVENKLFELINNNVPSAIIFYLKSRSDNYKQRMDIETTDKNSLTKEQRIAILKDIQKN